MNPELQAHFAAAQQAQSNGHYDDAEREYTAVLKLAPSFAEVHMNLGLVHQLQGHEVDAMKEFRAALKLKPALTGANFLLGVDYCKQGDGLAAIPYLQAAVSQQPGQVEFFSWLATAQDLADRWTAEVETLNRALHLQPRNTDLLYLLGQSYQKLGKKHAASLKKTAPGSSRAEQMVAESYAASNEWPSAVIHFQNALAKSPGLRGIHVELGEVYLHAGKLKNAADEFDKELALESWNLHALVRRGEVALLSNHVPDALKDWQRALDEDARQVKQVLGIQEVGFGDAAFELLPENFHARLQQAGAELESSSGAAAKVARQFITLQLEKTGTTTPADPGSDENQRHVCSPSDLATDLHHQRYSGLSSCSELILAKKTPVAQRIEAAAALEEVGECALSLQVLDSLPAREREAPSSLYYRARCYEKLATATYLRLYEADPNSYRVHQLLGDLAETRNEDSKAIEEYRAALAINPNVPNLHYNLGHVFWKDLKVPEARIELEAELEISPRHAGALHDLGDSYLLEHQPGKALPYLKQAAAAYPQNPDIHRDLGNAYAQLKDFAKAEAEYKVGISNDQDGSVHYKLAKVYQAMGKKQDADREFAIYADMNRQSHEKLEKRGQRLADIERAAQ